MGFKEGNTYSKGRPKGSINKIPTDLRGAIYEAFKQKGGVDYLLQLNDKFFVPLLRAVLPIELKANIKNQPGTHEDFLRELIELENNKLQQKRLEKEKIMRN